MTETRKHGTGKGSKWMTKEVIDVKYIGLEGLKEAITDAENRLTDIGFGHDTYDDYGSPEVSIYLEGWREATPEEILSRETELNQAIEQHRAWEEKQAAKLKIKRPDLFK